MKRIRTVAVVLLIAALAVPCTAADDKLFNKLDANKDGKLTKQELSGQKLVILPQKDGTKQVHHLDLLNGADASKATAMTEEDKQKLMEILDQDKDNSISRKEWDRASPNGFILWKY